MKNEPFVVPSNIDTPHAEAIHFDPSRPFYISISDPLNNKYTNLAYFSVIFRYFHNERYYETRDLKLCDLEDANGNLSFFESYGLGQMFCLKNRSFFLEGALDEGPLYAAVSILFCDNNTYNNTCKSSEEIFKYFDNFASQKYLSIIFGERRVDIHDYKNPIKITKRAISQLIDPNLKKKYTINFKKLSVETDTGYIFSDISNALIFYILLWILIFKSG